MAARLLKVEEVADRLNVSVWTVRKLAKEGSLRSRRIAGVLRFTESDVQELIDGAQSTGRAA